MVQKMSLRPVLLALLVGVSSVAYSLIDKVGVSKLHPVVYVTGLAISTTLFLAPYVLLKCRHECWTALASCKKYSLIIGLGSKGTYLLVLFVLQHANASYVVAACQKVAAACFCASTRPCPIVFNRKTPFKIP
jgi:hypothetical protein